MKLNIFYVILFLIKTVGFAHTHKLFEKSLTKNFNVKTALCAVFTNVSLRRRRVCHYPIGYKDITAIRLVLTNVSIVAASINTGLQKLSALVVACTLRFFSFFSFSKF